RVEAGGAGRAHQLLAVAQKAAVDEISAEQALDQRAYRVEVALRLRPGDQPVRLERVRLHDDSLERERYADLGAYRAYPRIDFGGAIGAAELGRKIAGARHTARRHVRIELEWMPPHGDIERRLASLDLAECRFELAFADVAPRTNDVRNDVDRKRVRRRVGGGAADQGFEPGNEELGATIVVPPPRFVRDALDTTTAIGSTVIPSRCVFPADRDLAAALGHFLLGRRQLRRRGRRVAARAADKKCKESTSSAGTARIVRSRRQRPARRSSKRSAAAFRRHISTR